MDGFTADNLIFFS